MPYGDDFQLPPIFGGGQPQQPSKQSLLELLIQMAQNSTPPAPNNPFPELAKQTLPSPSANNPGSNTMEQLMGILTSSGGDPQFSNKTPPVTPGLTDTSESSGWIPDWLEGALGGGKNPLGQPQDPGLTPEQESLAQLEALINQQLTGFSEEGLQEAIDEATGGIRQAYGAQIGAIKHQNQGARADTEEGRRKIQAMYKALNRSYKKAGKQERKQGANLAQQMANIGQGQTSANAADASQLLAGNAAAADVLDSPGLAQELNSEVNDATQRQNAIAQRYAQAEAQKSLADTGAASRFLNTQGMNMRLEGTNRASDLISQLQDYLQGNRDKISEIAGQRAQAVAAAKSALTSQYSSNQSDALNSAIDNYMQLHQMAFPEGEESSSDPMAELLGQLMPGQISAPSQLMQLGEQVSPGINDIFSKLMGGQSEDVLGVRDGTIGEIPGGGSGNDIDLTDNASAIFSFLAQNPETQGLPPEALNLLAAAIWQRLHGSPSQESPSGGGYTYNVQ